MDKNEKPIEKINAGTTAHIALLICVAGIICIGFIPQVYEYIYSIRFGM